MHILVDQILVRTKEVDFIQKEKPTIVVGDVETVNSLAQDIKDNLMDLENFYRVHTIDDSQPFVKVQTQNHHNISKQQHFYTTTYVIENPVIIHFMNTKKEQSFWIREIIIGTLSDTTWERGNTSTCRGDYRW